MRALVDWHNIDTIMLDMDGTLLDLHYDNYFWLQHLPNIYSQKNNISADAAHSELVQRFGREQGTLNWYSVDFWSAQLNMDVAQHKKDIAHLIQPRPGAINFLHAAAQSGRRVWLVTNAHHHSLTLKLAHTPLTQFCAQIFCSHDFNAPKESAIFWQALQAQESFNPARTLFIDDSEPVLHAAAAYGIAHCLTIAQPDSMRPARSALHFPVLNHFDDVLPIPYAPYVAPVKNA